MVCKHMYITEKCRNVLFFYFSRQKRKVEVKEEQVNEHFHKQLKNSSNSNTVSKLKLSVLVGNIIDGVDTTQMTREQLEVFCLRIKEENEREREERNFFQMERDKIRTFWEITRNELEEAKAKLRY